MASRSVRSRLGSSIGRTVACRPMAAVDVSGLVVRYGPLLAVDSVTFSADAGEVVAMLGPNGAGKTTTIETLEGYRSPTGGTVRVLGLDPVRDHARLTPRIGVMLQRGGVYPGIRAGEALRLFAAYYDDPADPEELLARVGLEQQKSTMWRHLSGGEQAPLPRPGPGRAARGRVPRRAHRRRRRGRPEGRAPHHPGAG